ncbi:MAG: hypothetical protein M5U19_09775 [Microthrixaceae bacterium]|nr:hypothetical protein [Microthrixaceae bacterium]
MKVASVGGLSFAGGIAESTVLILLTLTADGLIRGVDGIDVMGRSMARQDAILLAFFMVLVRVATILGAALDLCEVLGERDRQGATGHHDGVPPGLLRGTELPTRW